MTTSGGRICLFTLFQAVSTVVFLLEQHKFGPAPTNETQQIHSHKNKRVCRLTSDGVEGRFGPLLEALSELQDVLLLVQQRVGASVHFSLCLGKILTNQNYNIYVLSYS